MLNFSIYFFFLFFVRNHWCFEPYEHMYMFEKFQQIKKHKNLHLNCYFIQFEIKVYLCFYDVCGCKYKIVNEILHHRLTRGSSNWKRIPCATTSRSVLLMLILSVYRKLIECEVSHKATKKCPVPLTDKNVSSILKKKDCPYRSDVRPDVQMICWGHFYGYF